MLIWSGHVWDGLWFIAATESCFKKVSQDMGCCAAGSGWRYVLLNVQQPQSRQMSQSPTVHQKGGVQDLNGNAEMTAVALKICLKSRFVSMMRESEHTGWQGLKPFLCVALLPNKHTKLIDNRYLHGFARYALPCFCCLLCGLRT